MKIIIINGPNLNLIGKREPEIYGLQSFEEYLDRLKQTFENHDILYFQSNVEGEIINKLHEVGFSLDGIVLNAGAYTHTSVAIGDAVAAIKTPVVEVHISNVFSRETHRHVSYIAPNAKRRHWWFWIRKLSFSFAEFLVLKLYWERKLSLLI